MTIQQYLENHHDIGKLYNSYLISTDNTDLAFSELEQFVKNNLLNSDNLDTHPDYVCIKKLDATAKNITIDQIRQLQEFLYKTSILSGRKIAVIFGADQMNINASNSCLKILEDTPLSTHLFLITESASGILPTIRSRCAKINAHYNTDGKCDIDERFIKILLKSCSLEDKLDFIKEFTSKDRNLWADFSSSLESLLARLAKHVISTADVVSSFEKELLNQFSSNSPIYLQNKFEDARELIDNTNNFDLDLRASCVLLIEKFQK